MVQDSLDVPKEKKFMNGGYSAMKQRTKFSKRFLAVLLAMLMLLAAAQPVSFVAAAVGDDPDPTFPQDVAAGAYWDGETIRVEFPRASSPKGSTIKYYADLIDLDKINLDEVHLREVVAEGIPLQNDLMTIAESDKLTAAIQSKSLAGVDVSHRLDVAITAVDSEGWRSQPIHAVVGDSVRVPAADSTPGSSWWWKSFANFEEAYDHNGGDADRNAALEFHNDRQHGMNFDGVYTPKSNSAAYQAPGYVDENSTVKSGSNAYRFYITDPDQGDSADIHWDNRGNLAGGTNAGDLKYWNDVYNYNNAKELWIWVDMTNVRFGRLAFQVRPNDGGSYYNATGAKYSTVVFGQPFSTVNYYKLTHQEAQIKYVNSDGFWDTLTTEDGYLRNFGNYRGYLRISLDQLAGDSSLTDGEVLQVLTDSNTKIRRYRNYYSWGQKQEAQEVHALQYITSVGFTWENATADSLDQPFYIDNIGFAGPDEISGSGGEGVTKEQKLPYTTNQQTEFEKLIAEKLPATDSVNLSHKNVIEDLESVASITGCTSARLTEARAKLDQLLSNAGDDLPEYLTKAVEALGDNSSAEAIQPLYELYLTFTIDQLSQLGAKAEKTLLEAYNQAIKKTCFPDALASESFTPFNTFEQSDHYNIGDKSYHLYENTAANSSSQRKESPNFGDSAVKLSWESTRNLTSYSMDGDNTDGYRFGFGSTAIGGNGFMGSQSLDTRLNRRVTSNGERFRITFPYAGQNGVGSWDELLSCSIQGATDLMFYVDFSDVTTVRKFWVSLVGDNGRTYSHDYRSGALTYQRLDMSSENPAWQSVTVQESEADDGCIMNEIKGFKGFIKIPLNTFYAGATDNNNPSGDLQLATDGTVRIKQIRLQYTSTEDGSSQNVSSHLVFDMFGFVGAASETSFKDQYYKPIETKNFTVHGDAQELIDGLYADAIDLDGVTPLKLLDSSNMDNITKALQAYYSLSIEEKGKITFPSYKGTDANTKASLADILAVKANTETRKLNGEQVTGKLATYVEDAGDQRTTVQKAFGGASELEGNDISLIEGALDTYDSYPAKYQYTRPTYWADRNLNAVYPNYQATEVGSQWQSTTPHSLILNENGDAYTLTLQLPYVGTSDGTGFLFEFDGTVELKLDENTKVTATVQGEKVVHNGADQKLILTLTVAEADVKTLGTYTGSLEIGVNIPPDLQNSEGINQSNPQAVDAPEQYRKTYQIPLQLICKEEWSITIPADANIDWNKTEYVMGDLAAPTLNIPSTARVDVKIKQSENDYVLKGSMADLKYTLTKNGAKWVDGSAHSFRKGDSTSVPLAVQINQEEFDTAPYDTYSDVLTFEAEYVPGN